MGMISNALYRITRLLLEEQSVTPDTTATRWQVFAKTLGLYQQSPGGSVLRLLTTADLATLSGIYEGLDTTLDALAAYNTNGFLVQTAPNTFVGRSLTSGAGMTITNPAGAAGNPTIGLTHSGELFLSAAGGTPALTNGCAPSAKWETATNHQAVWTLDFDASAIEYAQWQVWMPAAWDGLTVTYAVLWTAASGSGDAVFTLEARAYANDDALDQAFGTGVDVTDTLTAIGDVDISPTSSAVTVGGSPAAGNPVLFRLSRKATSGSDTLAVDARVLGAKIIFGIA